MSLTDCRGVSHTTNDPNAIARLELATARCASYIGDPLAPIEEALAADPDFAMGHAFKAGIAVLVGERSSRPLLAAALSELERLSPRMNERERQHAGAARAWYEGDMALAVRRYGAIAVDHPHDLFALQLAHIGDFYLGDSQMLRDRPAQVVGRWDPSLPGMGYVLGMYAFGLEETALYARAEDTGLRALALDRRDPWAVHAVAHVMEMQGRTAEGVRWLAATEADWSAPGGEPCALAIHNFWHRALFHLDRGEIDEALALYDAHVRPAPSLVALNNVDASSFLWRLRLRGVDVGARWDGLAADWDAMRDDGFYAFSDAHAIMAYLGAGRADAVTRTIEAMNACAAGQGTNAMMTRDVGLPLSRALIAFDRGDYAGAIDALLPMRSIANRFGGSNAQRDVVHLTLTEAALRAGRGQLARALTAERVELRPDNGFSVHLAARARDLA